jgi:hypothetical protein
VAPDTENHTNNVPRSHILYGLLQFNTSAERGQQIPMQCQAEQLMLKETRNHLYDYHLQDYSNKLLV